MQESPDLRLRQKQAMESRRLDTIRENANKILNGNSKNEVDAASNYRKGMDPMSSTGF